MLEIALTDGFTPTLGQNFTFFTSSSLTGAWDRVTSPNNLWEVTYNANSATATYRGTVLAGAAAPEPSSLALLSFSALGFITIVRRKNKGA